MHNQIHEVNAVNTNYNVDNCSKVFINCKEEPQSLEEISNHVISNQQNCKICNECFSNDLVLAAHMAEHNKGLNRFYCPYCNYKTNGIKYLRTHLFGVHYKVKVSEEIENGSNLIEKKAKLDLYTNCFECTVCHKRYPLRKQLYLHNRVHKVEEKEAGYTESIPPGSFTCNYCNVQCNTREIADDHIKSHQETCQKCNLSFPNALILGIHMADHYQDDTFHCIHCNYKTVFAPYLKSHIFGSHYKKKSFKCHSCYATYCSKRQLNEHVRFYHDHMDPYACVVCERKFTVKTSLQKHQVKKHRPLVDGIIP
ncbi:gastrula zinc finger protein xFG20-1-like [Sitophilus oryzae]|uniref:Gastrula zinc finger protein xFG20-1-like n=1 Tax=Sitophilus oryzae TaxID=7048 RepID=A0A6J2XQ28_SITOR|nr:gastrula zinc finger protein xFG20-1-like [Sitophilus oryzae]